MRTKKNPEIPMVSKAHLKNVERQRDQYKAECNKLADELSWYKAKFSKLDHKNRFLLSRKDDLFNSWRDENERSVALSKRLEQLEQENEKQLDLLQDFSKFINYKLEVNPASDIYKHYRSELDKLGLSR
mgnify:CR=1 FL=1